jgi:hypothetical protein
MPSRLDELKSKFNSKLENRKPVSEREADGYHPIFSEMSAMELGEEIKDDVWNIVKVPGGYIVKRLNMGTVFVPET